MFQCRRVAVALLVLLSIVAATLAQAGDSTPVGELDSVRGRVMVSRAGSVLWEDAGNGALLYKGDVVKTHSRSSAMIRFVDGSFLKLMPAGKIVLDQVIETTGVSSNVVSLKSGKIWVQAGSDNDVNRLLVEAAGSVMDTTEGALFLEIEPGRRRACLDVFSGNASLRSLDNPEETSTLTKNQRTMLEADNTGFNITDFDNAFNTDNEQYSCITPLKKKEPVVEKKIEEQPGNEPEEQTEVTLLITGRAVIEFAGEKDNQNISVVAFSEEGEEYILITGQATITFEGEEAPASEMMQVVDFTETGYGPEEVIIQVTRQATLTFSEGEEEEETVVTDNEGTVVFTPESCTANGYECASELDCCSGICSGSVCAASERSVQYTTIVVSSQSSLSFKCQDAPTISGVKVGGASAARGDTVEIEGGECETEKSVSADWSVASCGTLKTEFKAYDSTGAVQQTESGSTFKITAEASKVEIKATDDGGESTYSFNVKLKEHESVSTPPEITSLTYAGETIANGDSIDVTIDSCEEGSFTMTGTAKSRCWDISSVSVTQDGEALSASGFTEWTATTKVAAQEKQSVFIATVTDSRGIPSSAYNLTINFTVAPELLEPPKIEQVTYNETSVSQGDTVSVSFDSCQAKQVTLSGQASTACGTIKEIKATKDGDNLYTSGESEWTAVDSISPTDETKEITITAENSSGQTSDAFIFSVEPAINVSPPVAALETVNNTTIEDFYSTFNVNKSDLDSGKMIIKGTSEADTCEIQKVEISLDDAGTWEAVEGTYSWTYEFTPSEGSYNVTARAVDILGNTSDDSQTLELVYSPLSDEDIVFNAFEKLIQAYLDEDSAAFIDLTSPDYTTNYDSVEDVNQLETSLDNKFQANEYIYLRYDIDSTTVTGDTARVAFRWDSDVSSSGYSQYGVFQFAKEENSWMFYTVEDENTFLRYTSIVATIDLTSGDTDLVADEEDSTEITAEVRDSAKNFIRDGSIVYFQVSPSNLGTITASAETLNGIAKATFTAGNESGFADITATSGDVTSSKVEIELHYEHAPCPPDDVDCTQ